MELSLEVFLGLESQISEGIFPGAHLVCIKVKNMNHSQVDFSYLVTVVIEEGHDAIFVTAFDVEFFLNFPLDSGEVGFPPEGIVAFIDGVNVSADAD